jgi:glycosyltransferase involved in cell wall biosynthesis
MRGGLDLVEVHNMPDALTFAALFPKMQGTPVILNCHDTFPELFRTKFQRPAGDRWVQAMHHEERLSASIVDHVITVTEEARQRLAARGVGAGRGTVVMNSPDPTAFGAPRAPSAPPSDGPLKVLYHGGLAPRFGVETMIRAVAEAGRSEPRIELRVCGTGEDRARLDALARELAPERIHVEPEAVPFAEIPAALEAAHIGVVPTLHDDFTELLLPVKLMEYVHMGLPVVSSRLPAIEGYFGADGLWYFEPGSPRALAETLLEVCRRPQDARHRAAVAALRLEQLAWAQQRTRYLQLVDDLVVSSRRGRRSRVAAPVATVEPPVAAPARAA